MNKPGSAYGAILLLMTMSAACGSDDGENELGFERKLVLASCGGPGSAKYEEIKGAATVSKPTVNVDCLLTLNGSERITKRIIISTSDVTIDCNGALIDGCATNPINYSPTQEGAQDMIEIRSTRVSSSPETWDRPENVLIRECNVIGSVRVYGMGKNQRPASIAALSRTSTYVETFRARAPRYVTFDSVEITALHRIPLYLAGGVTNTTVVNSTFLGDSVAGAIYLDAESGFNKIRNNEFHVDTTNDPVIAIDSSESNLIVGNYISGADEGGIYLYRNCGENATIRWTPPRDNDIVNNTFYYNEANSSDPSVFIGSRNGSSAGYCDDDEQDGYTYGSAGDDRSFATGNAVMQNQIFKFSPTTMIKTGDSSNSDNHVKYNQTVQTRIARNSGCFLWDGYQDDFLLDAEVATIFSNAKRRPYCPLLGKRCTDGMMSFFTGNTCSLSYVPFDCQVSGNNSGCSKAVSCPTGKTTIGASGACNLEYGTVTQAEYDAVPGNILRVTLASDTASDGTCRIGGSANAVSSMDRNLTGLQGLTSATVSCSEYDVNGGECHVKGELFCK
jgi:hypothetical protein